MQVGCLFCKYCGVTYYHDGGFIGIAHVFAKATPKNHLEKHPLA